VRQLANSDAAVDHSEGLESLLHPATPCSLSIAHPIGRYLRRTMPIDARQKGTPRNHGCTSLYALATR
jgi:hypothetical protein